MRLLRTDVEDLVLEDVYDEYEENPTKYAILSHTWLADKEEVKYADLHLPIEELKAREGWGKIEGSKRQARKDGYDHIWIDTLCIDKSSSTELGEAINSMYRWYEKSQVCYVYLQDLPDPIPISQCDEAYSEGLDVFAQPNTSEDGRSGSHPVYNPHKGTSPFEIYANDIEMTAWEPPAEPTGLIGFNQKYLDLSNGTAVDLVAFRAARWFT